MPSAISAQDAEIDGRNFRTNPDVDRGLEHYGGLVSDLPNSTNPTSLTIAELRTFSRPSFARNAVRRSPRFRATSRMGWIRGTGYFSDLILCELAVEIGF